MLRPKRSLSLPLLLAVSLILALGPAGCASGKARQHWWQFWRPKKIAAAALDPSGQPPDPSASDLPGGSDSIPPDGTLPTVGVLPGFEEPTPIRERPQGIATELRTVHFDYNSYVLSAEAESALNGNADWLKAHSGTEILIEGHCDERGSIEYNLNLGQQRANSVKQFLLGKGVPAEMLHTISYGEERPLDNGTGESAWARNRRAQFLVY